MKLIKLPNQKGHILSPWLTQEEAAAYIGISRETFRRLQHEVLPCPATGGNENNRRYVTPVLDRWWKKVGHQAERGENIDC